MPRDLVRRNTAPIHCHPHVLAAALTRMTCLVHKVPPHLQHVPRKPAHGPVPTEADAHRLVRCPEWVLVCPVAASRPLESEIENSVNQLICCDGQPLAVKQRLSESLSRPPGLTHRPVLTRNVSFVLPEAIAKLPPGDILPYQDAPVLANFGADDKGAMVIKVRQDVCDQLIRTSGVEQSEY